MFITAMKKIYWDLKDEIGRFNYKNSILMHLPGNYGFYLRNNIISKYFKSAGSNINIHQGVRFRGVHKVEIGDNCELGVDNFIQATGGLKLGDNVLLGPGVKIWTINHKFNDINLPVNQQGYEYLPVEIGNNVWIGANTFIMPGAKIPEGCIVSAGSVVGVKSFPSFSILAGNPARVIGLRDKQ